MRAIGGSASSGPRGSPLRAADDDGAAPLEGSGAVGISRQGPSVDAWGALRYRTGTLS